MVVDTACFPDPLSNSWNVSAVGSSSLRRARTTRDGSGPSSARRRSIMYSYSSDPFGGR